MDKSLAYNYTLVALFALLALVTMLQCVLLLVNRHSVFSYHIGFLVLCCLASIAKMCGLLFLALDKVVSRGVTFFCDETPLCFQLATFSLFAIFLSTVHNKRARRHAPALFVAWGLFITVIIVLECVFFWTKNVGPKDSFWNLLYAVVYSSVGSVVGFWGVRVVALKHAQAHTFAPELQQRHTVEIAFLTFGLALSFLSRGVYDLVVFCGYWGIQYPPFTGGVFVAIVVWDVVPILLVLIFFRQIPRTNSLTTKWLASAGSLTAPRSSGISEHSQLFANPRRYESDLEDNSSPSSHMHTYGTHTPTPPTTEQNSVTTAGNAIHAIPSWDLLTNPAFGAFGISPSQQYPQHQRVHVQQQPHEGNDPHRSQNIPSLPSSSILGASTSGSEFNNFVEPSQRNSKNSDHRSTVLLSNRPAV